MDSRVKKHVDYIDSMLGSMQTACGKAKRGSDVEDDYFFEKLEKLINILDHKLIAR